MGGIAAKNGMAALAFHSPSSVSLHAAPLGGSEMPERFKGSYVSASTLTAEANFVNQTQQWHVIGSGGVDVRESPSSVSRLVVRLPFASLLTVTEKRGGCVKISKPVIGWLNVASSVGYLFLAKGGPEAGVKWRYRVVCRHGAFVRHGIELTSAFLFPLPWHSVVEVLERRINEAGLPRLKIAEGWISEVLNPLSGQRGPVVEIVKLLRPLRYKVSLAEGAVVRRSVELASNEVKRVSCGDVVEVSAKQFSDLGNRCVQRLKLDDDSGWLSMRLNKDPPEDLRVVEYVGIVDTQRLAITSSMSSSTSASNRRAIESLGYAGAGGILGATGELEGLPPLISDEGDGEDKHLIEDLTKIKREPLVDDDTCVVCLTGQRTATIVHGEIGHIACCLECARILKARGDSCPVCRVPIDSVVQHFWA